MDETVQSQLKSRITNGGNPRVENDFREKEDPS
jgi:hypothetical protein